MAKDYTKEILIYLFKKQGTKPCNLKPLVLGFNLTKSELFVLLMSLQNEQKLITSDNEWTHYCHNTQQVPMNENAPFNFSLTQEGRQTALIYLSYEKTKTNTNWVIIGAIAAIIGIITTIVIYCISK